MFNQILFDTINIYNYNSGFLNTYNDTIVHLLHWQYWWWFWFTFLLSLYYIIFIRFFYFRSLKFHPKIATSFRSHGKWGDLLICILPISWCLNILSNSTTLLKLLEWQSESNFFIFRVRGKQWYWIYKFDSSSLENLLNTNTLNRHFGTNNVLLPRFSENKTNLKLLFEIQNASKSRTNLTTKLVETETNSNFINTKMSANDSFYSNNCSTPKHFFKPIFFKKFSNFDTPKSNVVLNQLSLLKSLDQTSKFILNDLSYNRYFRDVIFNNTGVVLQTTQKFDFFSSIKKYPFDYCPLFFRRNTYLLSLGNILQKSFSNNYYFIYNQPYIVNINNGWSFHKYYCHMFYNVSKTSFWHVVNRFSSEHVRICVIMFFDIYKIVNKDLVKKPKLITLTDIIQTLISRDDFKTEKISHFNFKITTTSFKTILLNKLLLSSVWVEEDIRISGKPTSLKNYKNFETICDVLEFCKIKLFFDEIQHCITLFNSVKNQQFVELPTFKTKICKLNTLIYEAMIAKVLAGDVRINFNLIDVLNNIYFLVWWEGKIKRILNTGSGLSKFVLKSFEGGNVFFNIDFDNSYTRPNFNNLYLVIKQKPISDWSKQTSSDYFTDKQLYSSLFADTYTLNESRKILYINNMRLLRLNKILFLPSNLQLTAITNSFDVIHSWFLPGLGLKMDCVPGRSTHHSLFIDVPGIYYGQCAEICGRFHHHMPIRVCALSNEHFLLWLNHNLIINVTNNDSDDFTSNNLSKIN